MGFQIFRRGLRRTAVNEPIIKLARYGEFWANAKAMEWFASKDFVLLAYDAERHLIGMKPTNADPDAYKWSFGKQRSAKGSARITARAFFKHIGLKLDRPQIFSPYWDDKLRMVIIDLKQGR